MESTKLQLNFDQKKIGVLDGLNDQQKKAVTHKNGPLLIIAGAGTGKTAVITRRIAYIIEQKWVKSSEILALTFTEKAAAEMETRVDELTPYGYTDMWISTFHAFGDRFLRDYAISLGLPANFKVLTATEQAIFMRQNIFAFDLKHFRPIANPLSHIKELLNHFSRLKDELISPEEYLAWAEARISKSYSSLSLRAHPSESKTEIRNKEENIENEKNLELANAYARYQELMIQSGNLDFGDQIFLTHKLLKENKKVLDECRKIFRYILVDEFQDTNFAQNEIIKLLAGKSGNITVVGDDDQSIYRFRGAAISNILDFKKFYQNSTEIILNQNYRSTAEILNSSYKLIQNNNPERLEIKNKINKKLLTEKHGADPELIYSDTLSCEADSLVNKIKELKSEKGYQNNDFAILVRANSQAEPFIQSLNLAGIPSVFSGASGLFSQPEIKMLVAFLKCLAYTDDNLAFYQLATSEIYNISHDILSEIYTLARRSNRGIIELLKTAPTPRPQASGIGVPTASVGEALNKIVSDIEKYRRQKNDPVGEILYQYLTEKKYLKKISKKPTVEDEIKIVNIAKFFDCIAQFNHSSDSRDVLTFLENLELILEVGDEVSTSDIDPDLQAVNILTVHAAKGLEWPVVFIVNCVSDRFPTRKRREQLPIPIEFIKERLPEGDWHLQEERRLFYVAATRAKNYLYLTAGQNYGGKRLKKLSQFVLELLGQPDPSNLKHKLIPLEKIERFKKLEQTAIKLPDKFSDKILKLSRQQIDDYYSCPKKFYYAHIIKIPLLENQQLMYGTAIHAALDHYFARKINKQKTTLKQLQADFKQAFKNVGFITREQEEQRFSQGLDSLTRFFNADQKEQAVPTKVEEVFEFLLSDVKIKGRFDLIFKAGESVEIRDFKTSDVREQKDADRRIKESTQMMIYALAWQKKCGTIPKTSLYFIESGISGNITFKMADLEKTCQMISDVVAGIRAHDMAATPDIFNCKYCPYRDICPEAI